MKKFLSLLLALLMVVGMVPLFVFTSFAAPAGAAEEETAEQLFPELVITELYVNTVNYRDNVAYWKRDWPAESGIYSAPSQQETYYSKRSDIEIGTAVPSGTFKTVTDANGVVSFVSTTETAVEGTAYYRLLSPSDIYDVFTYMEVYNSGTEALNLYDYKLIRDGSSTYAMEKQNSDGSFATIKPGAIQSSFQDGFEPVLVNVGESVKDYYTVDSTGKVFTPCGSRENAVDGVTYYRTIGTLGEGECFINNPDTAILQPGQCAVLWFYTQYDNQCRLKMEYFREYFEYNASTKAMQIDMSDVLILGVEANNQTASGGFSDEVGFKIELEGQRRYGIVASDYDRIHDGYANTLWISSARYEGYAGFDASKSAIISTDVTVGSTNVVTTGKYFYKDEVTGLYLKPTNGTAEQIANGTASADEFGLALEGVIYYTVDLSKSNVSPLSHRLDKTSVNFLYGLDSNSPVTEGVAYTISNYGNTPGCLTEAQYATLPNGEQKTSAPKLVITEVVPDNVGDDSYEYVEVVNTSGSLVNIFDYSFVARSASFMSETSNEFFNKISPLIPGDKGNILASEPGAMYYDTAPSNISYSEGWLEPGETAVLWSYYDVSARNQLTIDDFYAYFDMDKSVKVIAMDTDNTSLSGRLDRQNLGNSGAYLYGLVANENLNYVGEMYTSNPVMGPITYANGFTSYKSYGIRLADAESFVVAVATFATCTSAGLGEDFGYQFVWKQHPGVNNKCGAYYNYARMTRWSSSTEVSFTGSVVTDDWKASPGTLLPRQKTALTTDMGDSRYVLYMQDFAGVGTVTGYDDVAALLGTTPVGTLSADSTFEIKDGKLYISNRGTATEYVTLMSDAILNTYRKTNFTIEYAMTYDADSVVTGDGYSGILFGYDAASNSYAAPIVRIAGYGQNEVVLKGAASSIESGSATTMNATSGAGTLLEKLTGTAAPDTGLVDSGSLAGKTVTVRVDVSYTNGVTVFVNDVKVSATADASSEAYANWAFFCEQNMASDLVMVTTPGISVAYDYIMVYSDSVGTNPSDMDLGSLYITELTVNGGKNGNIDISWARYIEISNGSDQVVDLSEYAIVRGGKPVTEDGKVTTYSHVGNNNLWENAEVVKLSDWLGSETQSVRFGNTTTNAGNKNNGIENPSINDAMLQPGESMVVIFLEGGNSAGHYKKQDASSSSKLIPEAFRSHVQMPDDYKVMTVFTKATYKKVGTSAAKKFSTTAFSLADAEENGGTAYIYGLAKVSGDKTASELEADFANTYTHDYRVVDSIVDHTFSLVTPKSTASSDSLALEGFATHYLYGNDHGMFYKYGTIMNRQNNNIVTEQAAGRLYHVQQSAFEQLRNLKTYGYQDDAGLVITEYIPDTYDDRGGSLDAFESVEITNISARPINLYNYALVESPTTYGCTDTWDVMDQLNGGPVANKYHPWYDQLQYINNPEECIVAPGETIVVWNYYTDTYNLANVEPKRDYISVEDFRNYWASHGNTAITEKDEEGNYKVKVIVIVTGAAGMDTFNLSNNGTVTIGLSVKNTLGVAGKNGNTMRAADVVSYATNPLNAMAWDLTANRVQLMAGSTVLEGTNALSLATWPANEVELADFGVVLYENESAFGYYTVDTDGTTMLACSETDVVTAGVQYFKAEEDGSFTRVYTNSEIVVENYFTKSDAGYALATGVHANISYAEKAVELGASVAGLYVKTGEVYVACGETDVAVAETVYYERVIPTYYKLYYYQTVQNISSIANESYNFVYGTTFSGKWSAGSLVGTTHVASRTYCATSDPAFFNETPNVSVDILARGARAHSLGYLLEEQQGMVAMHSFTEAAELEDGAKVYVYQTVDTLPEVAIELLGATVTHSETGTTVAFTAMVRSYIYEEIAARYGAENVSFGMLLARTETLLKSGMTVRDLISKPVYVPAEGLSALNYQNGLYTKSYENIYRQCAADAFAQDGVTYYSFDGTEYTEVAEIGLGTPTAGLYTLQQEEVFVSCDGVLFAERSVIYYEEVDGVYSEVVNVVPGETEISDYFTATHLHEYIPCRANEVVLEGVDYYIPEGNNYVLDHSPVGVSAEGLYLRNTETTYTSCDPFMLAENDVVYYRFDGTNYKEVLDIAVGETEVSSFFKIQVRDAYVACEEGYVLPGVTYYTFEEEVAVEETVTLPDSVAAYFTKSYEAVYTLATDGVVAVPGVTYYRQNGNGSYSIVYGLKSVDVVTGLYTQNEDTTYTACANGAPALTGVVYYEKGADVYAPVAELAVGDSVENYFVLDAEVYVACAAGALAEDGVTYYAKTEGAYTPVAGLKTVDSVAGYYTLQDGNYVECAEGDIALAGTTYYKAAVEGYSLQKDITATPDVRDNMKFTSEALAIPAGYYTDSFVSVAFVTIKADGQEYYFLADDSVCTITQLVASAMLDISDVQTEEYCYEVGDGTWSRYTAAQRAQFAKLCA